MPTTMTGKPKTTAEYSCETARRKLVAQRVDGTVQLRDEPAGDGGRKHLVEPEILSMAELDGVVADYVKTAERIDAVPMAECWY